ncbi:RING-H2 finger protein ATL2 [Cryptomeria japonica]|uniref:RING-H2 finger protein ATL2 n=1 Tax=Cryptomeria japonica TaxID=3369 RepID=UPI0027DA5307|nr:RING-H2 finger protein ATL2 [Cryptomeria japonica]
MGNSGAAQFVALLNKLSLVVFIVAVILVVYLIARCIRISNRRSSITFHSHGARRNHSAEENPSIIDMPVGLHREFVEALPIFVYEPEKMKIGLECAVCLGEFQENDKGRILPNCSHSFHIDCIDMWLFSHSTCPVCRTKIEGFSPGKKPELPASENLRGV